MADYRGRTYTPRTFTPEQRQAKREREQRFRAAHVEQRRDTNRTRWATAKAKRDRRESVEIAVARQWPVLRIMTELGVSYEQYRAVRDDMDTADTRERPCPHCDKSYVNLGRHVSAAHPETKAAVA